jgi:hypothetical protein
MPDPVNQHWLPQFMMAPWLENDGRVLSFYRPFDKIVARRKSIKTLASEENLYTAKWSGFEDAYFVEKVFARLENSAALVRDKLINGKVGNLSAEEKEVLAFVLSMQLIRTPEKIQSGRTLGSEKFRESLSNSIQLDIAAGRVDSEDADRFISDYGQDLLFKPLFEVAHKWVEKWLSLSWRVFDFSDCRLKLVLSDNPVQLFGDASNFKGAIVPVSPTVLLVVGDFPAWYEVKFSTEYREPFAIDCIGDQFRRSKKFVIAKLTEREEGYLSLAEKYMPRSG